MGGFKRTCSEKDVVSLRTTTDFRDLNSVTESYVYPMEDLRTSLDWLSSKKVYSTIDLKDGFYQVWLDKESRPMTAVRTVIGLFQYFKLPMGLKNSSATFQGLINEILGDLKDQCVWCYIDDARIGSMTPEQHIKELEVVLNRFMEAGAKIKLSKCTFGTSEVTFLGHKVTKDGIQTSGEHLKAIRDLEGPRNGAHLFDFKPDELFL